MDRGTSGEGPCPPASLPKPLLPHPPRALKRWVDHFLGFALWIPPATEMPCYQTTIPHIGSGLPGHVLEPRATAVATETAFLEYEGPLSFQRPLQERGRTSALAWEATSPAMGLSRPLQFSSLAPGPEVLLLPHPQTTSGRQKGPFQWMWQAPRVCVPAPPLTTQLLCCSPCSAVSP